MKPVFTIYFYPAATIFVRKTPRIDGNNEVYVIDHFTGKTRHEIARSLSIMGFWQGTSGMTIG